MNEAFEIKIKSSISFVNIPFFRSNLTLNGSTPKVGEEFGKISIFAKKRNWKII